MQAKPLKYVSEITGSGKTNNLLNRIAKSKDKFLLAFPTKDLCDEILNYLHDRGVIEGVDVVHSNIMKNPSHAIRDIVDRKVDTRIILTTHASLKLSIADEIPASFKAWNLVIDEEMEFFKSHEFNVSDASVGMLEKTIAVEEYNDTFYKMVPKDNKLWTDILNGRCADTFMDHPKLVSILSYAASEKYITLIPKMVYDRFIEDVANLEEGKFKKLYAMSLLTHEFFNSFKEILVLCSFYERTISHRMLEWLGIPTTRMTIGKVKPTHNNSELINIHYFTNTNWTQTLRRKEVPDINGRDVSIEKLVRDKVLTNLVNKGFIYTSNRESRGAENFGSGVLVTSIHGVNSYINYTNMVYMQSLNATGSEVNLLSYFGISRQDVDFARTVLGAYQFISRGAVRKSNNKDTVNIFVMDKRTVDFLKSVFPEAEVTYHGIDHLIKAEEIKAENKTERVSVPPKIRTMVSRVRKKLKSGENIRGTTLKRYHEAIDKFYA